MSIGMASFLAGFGGGYLKSKRQATEDERQAKIDQLTFDRADREKADYEKRVKYETDLADAGKPLVAEQTNDVLKDDDGNDMPAVPAFRTSDGQRFDTMAAANESAAKANTSDAISARQANVMQANGKVLEAVQMTNAITQAKLNKLGLTKAEGEHADNEYNRTILKSLDANPDWTVGASEILTNANTDGLKGLKVSARPSADGKTVDFVGLGEDGVEKKLKTFPNNAQGKADFLQTVGKASLESKISYVVDRAKTDQAQSNWQQTFDFNRKKEESDTQYKNRMLGFQANQDARASEVHKVAMADAKIPPAVKTIASSYQEQIKSASAALNKAMAEGQFDPDNPGTKQLIKDQKEAMQNLADTLAPYSKKAEGPAAAAAAAAQPLGQPPVAPAVTSNSSMTEDQYRAQVAANGGKPPPVSMQQAAATPAPAVTAPKAQATVLEALNPGGNQSLNSLMQPKAQAIEGLAAQLKQQQALMVKAAQSNPQAAIAQAQQVQAIRNSITKQLQAALVIKAAGI